MRKVLGSWEFGEDVESEDVASSCEAMGSDVRLQGFASLHG